MKLSASDFEFCVLEDGSEPIVLISHPDEHMQDQEIGHIIKELWPVGIVMDEVTESTFEISEDMDAEQVKRAFIEAGFTFSQEFQDSVQ